jgi:hypothetical protein
LLLIEDIAASWAAGILGTDFRTAFQSRTNAFRSGISQTAETRYRHDYEREYRGSKLLLGPHFARGIGPPTEILRIYWAVDDEERRLVVGHVGRKLRDVGNRN